MIQVHLAVVSRQCLSFLLSCLYQSGPVWAPTRFCRRSARAGWGRSTGRSTRGSGARWRSRSCPSRWRQDAERLRRFEKEARAVGALNHPNILTVHDVGSHDGSPYVVTELLEGETLREVLLRRAPSTRQVLSWAVQAAQGLAAAHQKGIVHRDIKPENLFLTADGRVKILDFGLAKLMELAAPPVSQTNVSTDAQGTDAGVILGTVAYMSPEQVRGGGGRSSLRHLLAGGRPLRAAVGRASVPASDGAGDSDGDPARGAARAFGPPVGDFAGRRPDRPPVPGEAPGGAFPVGARPGAGAGGRSSNEEARLRRCGRSRSEARTRGFLRSPRRMRVTSSAESRRSRRSGRSCGGGGFSR